MTGPVKISPWSVTEVTGPTGEPVALAEAKKHIRETATGQDALISSLVTAAREAGEEETRRAWMTQTFDYKIDEFPNDDDPIYPPRPPLQSVEYIRYIDTDGATATLTATAYRVDADSEPARITPAHGKTWPISQDVTSAVTIRCVAGYGTATEVPQRLKQAALLTVGDWYENRESNVIGTIVSPLPNAADRIYRRMRAYRLEE